LNHENIKKLVIFSNVNFDLLMNLNRKLSQVALMGFLSIGLVGNSQAAFVYLSPDSINLRAFPPAPMAGSPDDQADLAAVRRYQSIRTVAECARATDEANISLMSFFGMTHAVLSPTEVNTLIPLYTDIADDAEEFIAPLKNSFRRPRPFQRDPSITLCVPLVSGWSYPSGHATLARLSARVLSLIYPERTNALLARGDEIGLDRVIGGVHHPRDILAGQLLGEEVFQALTRNGDFMRRIDTLRAKIRFYNYAR
jgi:acid phosphatase (class A)